MEWGDRLAIATQRASRRTVGNPPSRPDVVIEVRGHDRRTLLLGINRGPRHHA
jgi:hypothetical protein